MLGPNNIGGRVRAIAINPTNPSFSLAGSSGSGPWKSADAGSTWQVVDDFLPVLSIASIVYDPINPNIAYAGTGEPFAGADRMVGDGIYKSTDGGLTWAQLPATANNPSNPDSGSNFSGVFRLALSRDGTVLLVRSDSGMFRSTDGGASFTRLVDANGITVGRGSTFVFDPTDSMKAVAR